VYEFMTPSPTPLGDGIGTDLKQQIAYSGFHSYWHVSGNRALTTLLYRSLDSVRILHVSSFLDRRYTKMLYM